MLIGTFYPLGLEVATGARITVGPPYFEATFTPVMGLLVVCMAGGPLLVWRAGILPSARTALIAGGIGAGLALMAGAAMASGLSAAALAGLALIGWLALSIIGDLWPAETVADWFCESTAEDHHWPGLGYVDCTFRHGHVSGRGAG